MFKFINNKVTPVLMNYAELELRKFSTLIINKAISKQISDDMNIDDLFIITKDGSGEIKTIDFNPLIVNKLLTLVTNSVQLNLKYIEDGELELMDIPNNVLVDYDKSNLKKGVIFEIPSGIVFNNSLLSNIGPKIPVKLNLVGDIVSNIKTQVTNYGINNAMIEVSINMEVTEQVILPFASKKITVITNIPVAIKLIQGSVPNYYFNGIDKMSPNLSIPVE
jgi:sporulation protein YunB